MQVDSGPKGVKRTYRAAFLPDELKNRFGCKEEMIQYFSEHLVSNLISVLIVTYSNFMFLRWLPSTATL